MRIILFHHKFINDFEKLLAKIESQHEYLKMLMELSRQDALLSRTHREPLVGMQQEMHRDFQRLEESMQKRLEEVEQRVLASVRDVLPGLIREEMRNLQENSATSNDST